MASQPQHPVVRATLWMSGALFSFMTMAIGGRELAGAVSTFEILFFRSLIGLIAVSIVLSRRGWGQLATDKFGTHALRNLAHFGGQYGWFYGLGLIPLAEVFAIEFTVPVWTAILAALLLSERITRPRVIAIVLGIAGIWLILRPGLAVVHPAAIAVLLSAVGYALSHTLTKKLAGSDTPLAILFYMTAIQLPLGLFPALPHWVTPPATAWPWLIAVGIAALTAHYCMARALRLADATVVVPMDFLRLPLAAVVGFLFYSEKIEWWVFAGALLILAGSLTNIRAERRRVGAVVPTSVAESAGLK
jgi:drug/metabolite transporter (DMT)-like permease